MNIPPKKTSGTISNDPKDVKFKKDFRNYDDNSPEKQEYFRRNKNMALHEQGNKVRAAKDAQRLQDEANRPTPGTPERKAWEQKRIDQSRKTVAEVEARAAQDKKKLKTYKAGSATNADAAIKQTGLL